MEVYNNKTKYIRSIILLCISCCILVFCLSNSNSNVYAESNVPKFDYSERIEMKVQISVDGSIPIYRFNELQPYFDHKGITMFPLVHFYELFKGDITYEIDGNKVTFTKKVLDVLTVVSVMVDSNILVRDGQDIEMNTTPVQKDGVIYIPLEYVGDALSYHISWNSRNGYVNFNQYTSIYIFVWNENEDSSLEGLRYSYIISGDYPTDLLDIKSIATANYEEVRDVLKKLSPKAEVLTTKLYRIKGYAVPYQIFNNIISEIFSMGFKTIYMEVGLDKIPPLIKNLSSFTNKWFSEVLFSLDEEAIYDSKKEVYRYFIISSFRRSIVVRIEIEDNGTAYIYYKISNKSSEEHTDGINKTRVAELTKDEIKAFHDLLNEKNYWNLPTEIKGLGADGHEVVIEGVKNGTYHIVERWVPEKSDPVYAIQEYIMMLIQQKFTEQILEEW